MSGGFLLVGSLIVATAVVLIILLNAAFAFVQEVQAERAVAALAQYLPQRAKALRDGEVLEIDASELVPGDIGVIEQGDRIAADVRLLAGAIEADMSALTGESVPTPGEPLHPPSGSSTRSSAALQPSVRPDSTQQSRCPPVRLG